jgi:hypothetical protein
MRLSKGQLAMAVARICFETKRAVHDGAKQLIRNESNNKELANNLGVSNGR